MKNRTHSRVARQLAFLLLVVIFAALASLSFYPHSATYAQTGTSETLAVPALTARATGTNTVELSWTAVTGAVRYELWAWDSATRWQQLGGGSLTGMTYTHTGVMAGTTYYYSIRYLPVGKMILVYTYYADTPYSKDKPYIFTVDRRGEVIFLAW